MKAKYMSFVEYRRFIRHPLCFPLSFKEVKSKEEELQTKTINVCLGGLLFPSKSPVKVRGKVVIKMPFENKVFNVRAKVVRCKKNSKSKLYEVAVCFTSPQEAFKVKIIEQIYLIAEYRDLLALQLGREVTMEEASQKWIKRYSARFSRLYW
jgi:hypothetical protein